MSTRLVNKSIESFRFKLDFPFMFLIINKEFRPRPLHLNIRPLFKKIYYRKNRHALFIEDSWNYVYMVLLSVYKS